MRIRKSRLLFTLGLFFSFWSMSIMCFGYTAAALAAELILREGTPVVLSTEKTINSTMARVGDPVDFVVTRDVKVDDKIVISTGTHARGEVSAVERRGGIGKPGRVSIIVKSVKAIDGTEVPIRATLTREGKGKETTALLVGLLLCIIGLFLIKGEDGVIQAGSEIKAYVDYDVEINIQ